jgi:DNA-directed RNA polymerase specialized sigma24 family protein
VLLHTFNELRDELVSTLWFVLGWQEDAHDVAQEAFLRWVESLRRRAAESAKPPADSKTQGKEGTPKKP